MKMLRHYLEVAGTARTFLPKRTIHGTTEEARLNSVRGFLCDVNVRILHMAFSSSTMLELDLLRGREKAEEDQRAGMFVTWTA